MKNDQRWTFVCRSFSRQKGTLEFILLRSKRNNDACYRLSDASSALKTKFDVFRRNPSRFSPLSTNWRRRIVKLPAIVNIQPFPWLIYQWFTLVWWISLRPSVWKMSKLKLTVSDRLDSDEPLEGKSPFVGKFVSIRGVVVRVSNSQCLVTRLAYECSTCRHTFGVTCENGCHTEPERCTTPGCIGRSFVQQRSHSLTTIIDWQTIR